MYKIDNGQEPPAGRGYRLPEAGPLPDLPLYERLIDDSIAAADSRGTIVDHLTARRLAIWLAARLLDGAQDSDGGSLRRHWGCRWGWRLSRPGVVSWAAAPGR